MALTLSGIVDDTGELLTITAAGAAGVLAGDPLFTVNGVDELEGTIDDLEITVPISHVRRGEPVVVTYDEGMTDDEEDVEALAVPTSNLSERTPDVVNGMVRVNENTGGIGNLAYEGLVKLYRPADPRVRPFAVTNVVNGRWQSEIEVPSGVTYTVVAQNGRVVKTIAL